MVMFFGWVLVCLKIWILFDVVVVLWLVIRLSGICSCLLLSCLMKMWIELNGIRVVMYIVLLMMLIWV